MNYALRTYVSLAHKAGLPPNIMNAISLAYRLQIVMQQIIRLAHIMHLGMGPVGWALALAGVASTTLMAGDMFYDASRGS